MPKKKASRHIYRSGDTVFVPLPNCSGHRVRATVVSDEGLAVVIVGLTTGKNIEVNPEDVEGPNPERDIPLNWNNEQLDAMSYEERKVFLCKCVTAMQVVKGQLEAYEHGDRFYLCKGPDWYRKANSAKRMMITLQHRLQLRLGRKNRRAGANKGQTADKENETEKAKKQRTDIAEFRQKRTFERTFLMAASRMLPKEVYQLIIKSTDNEIAGRDMIHEHYDKEPEKEDKG